MQLVGLTAALAAAAGTAAAGLTSPSSPTSAGTSLDPAQAQALTAARVDRRDLGSRDQSRLDLSLASAQKAAAAKAAKERAAKAAAQATLNQRRALALAAAKAAAAAKAKAAAQAAAAKAQALAKAKAEAEAKAKARAKAQARAAAQAAAKAAAVAKARASTRIVLPTTGYHLTAHFGQAGGRWSRDHTGLDFAAPTGTPVRSVLAGEVIQAEFAGAYGRQVKVRHSNGTVTSYSHMSKFSVSVGERVPAGGQVGAIGMTGNTTGPHVHFEVLLGGSDQIDPEPWLRARGVNP
ncbi:murein DD-endopeptidase MepM/ murein hydrolase activator NlpD [Kribbella amoyensis]|uniref:Murein DD-endopeptidase MepM/ murein hydrolase activator NlpD n=1 Tax=Kribbella amoyensis TaxID=996641 RepID=A0A561BL21_9ACTN|nr:M23 family metallopeptidase [Kribbella amoyensis]TWD79564.1 murein DD-endopeptidase MepM/ murein hydrolase activator NlpD [Kribbella amoyensis]